MLHNINSYGLSHLCDFSIFERTEEKTFSFPFLDVYFKTNYTRDANTVSQLRIHSFDAEFYSRGNKYYKTSFNNLFEYHIFNEQSGYKD